MICTVPKQPQPKRPSWISVQVVAPRTMLSCGENGKFQLNTPSYLLRVEVETDIRGRSTLSFSERKEYTDAVLCLRELPPITPKEIVPGARSRFDDIHAEHINQTLWVHLSAYFLPWHRLFVHAWEKALRDECGYTGAQPYVCFIWLSPWPNCLSVVANIS